MTTHATLVVGRHKFYDIAAEINGEQVTLGESAAREYWEELTEKQRYALANPGWPTPSTNTFTVFESWWSKKTEHRTWQAAFITADRNEGVGLSESMDWTWGFPVTEAARLLDRFSAEGWRLVHVSEDHGLYSGADAANEAYLVRVRYLLTRD